MGKAELAFHKKLREGMELHGFSFFRVENHGIDPGMPDLHFVTTEGLTGWIEVKDEPLFPRRIAYEKNQPAWLLDYTQRGGFCCTVVNLQKEDALLFYDGDESLVASQNAAAAIHRKLVGVDRYFYLSQIIRTCAASRRNVPPSTFYQRFPTRKGAKKPTEG